MLAILHAIIHEFKPVEIVAAVTSLLCVYLTIKNNLWNWAWGLIGSVLYAYILWRGGLYANAGLFGLYFVPMQFVGWYVWLRGGPRKQDDLPVTMLSAEARLGWLALTAGLWAALYFFIPPLVVLLHIPPWQLGVWDAFTTALSISAQYLQTYKRWENWVLWIVADLVYTFYLFPHLHLPVTTGLYAIFTVLAFVGAWDWYRLQSKAAPVR